MTSVLVFSSVGRRGVGATPQFDYSQASFFPRIRQAIDRMSQAIQKKRAAVACGSRAINCKVTGVLAYGPTRKNLALAPESGTVAGLAVPTGVQVAPVPSVELDCRVPPVGVQEMTTLAPEREAFSVAWLFGLVTNELL